MGELQRLKPRCCCLHHDACPSGGPVPLPYDNLQAIGAGFARGTGAMKQEQLKDVVEDTAKSLAGDVNLFGEVDGEGQAQ